MPAVNCTQLHRSVRLCRAAFTSENTLYKCSR